MDLRGGKKVGLEEKRFEEVEEVEKGDMTEQNVNNSVGVGYYSSYGKDFVIVQNNRGNPTAILDGCRYRKYRTNNNCVITWICNKQRSRKCKGRMKSLEGKVVSIRPHTCLMKP
ncbi:unnamed protein product [Psylliodes chrysocephalus]|uniref:FLYWCH-type domain-containing protein n=1 Tax=Psylliodes chrysocephalus TaxID=3402493 RepID=A0A9P0CQR5_9CUCU|nr:unnamed protein product [Psylliodes chrysocephala]